jgi:phosphoenolpyruvate carboxylase
LSLDETVAFVRSFMLFSMLANLAEDRQGAATEKEGTLASALQFLTAQGVQPAQIAQLLERALIVPVLTAHPTEVMRKSMLDHRNRIAALMRQRDTGQRETRSGELIEEAIAGQIALLWQTRALRHERLYVADEVDTALAYLRDVFLPTMPALYARWERMLGMQPPSFLRLGSWIGGDRDGNPHVTADSLRLALGRASQTLLTDYLEQLNALGAELSLSSERAAVSPGVEALARNSGDANAARADEPYRRAITGMYARLAATYQKLFARAPPRAATVSAESYPDAHIAVRGSGGAAGIAAIREQNRPRQRRAVAPDPGGRDLRLSFGDTRSAAKRRRARPRGRRAAAGRRSCADYQSLDEAARVELLRRELASERLLASPFAGLLAGNAFGTGHRARRRRGASALRPRLHHQLRHFQVRKRLRSAGGQRAAEGGGVVPRAARNRRDHGRAAVRDHRRFAARPASDGKWLGLAETAAIPRRTAIKKSWSAIPIRTRTAAI